MREGQGLMEVDGQGVVHLGFRLFPHCCRRVAHLDFLLLCHCCLEGCCLAWRWWCHFGCVVQDLPWLRHASGELAWSVPGHLPQVSILEPLET